MALTGNSYTYLDLIAQSAVNAAVQSTPDSATVENHEMANGRKVHTVKCVYGSVETARLHTIGIEMVVTTIVEFRLPPGA